ncbi:MAG: hypothetical protein ACFB13_01910 [Kiloniellaceae bacterium]
MQAYGQGYGLNGINRLQGLRPSLWERLASGVAALGTFAFFFSAVGYGWYSLLLAMAR